MLISDFRTCGCIWAFSLALALSISFPILYLYCIVTNVELNDHSRSSLGLLYLFENRPVVATTIVNEFTEEIQREEKKGFDDPPRFIVSQTNKRNDESACVRIHMCACVRGCVRETHLPFPATGKCHEEYYYSATPYRLPFLINVAPKHISYQDNLFVLVTLTEVFDLRDEPCNATNCTSTWRWQQRWWGSGW